MTKTRSLTHTIQEGSIEEFERSLWTFLRSVRSAEPATHYQVYQLEDGVTYLHLATFPSDEHLLQHLNAPYTNAFRNVTRRMTVSESSDLVQPIAS